LILISWAIDLVTEEKDVKNIPFHFNPRFHERVLVINNQVNGSWDNSKEVRLPFPEGLGRGYSVSIRVTLSGETVVVRKIFILKYRVRVFA
jgi:hypothetical protein